MTDLKGPDKETDKKLLAFGQNNWSVDLKRHQTRTKNRTGIT